MRLAKFALACAASLAPAAAVAVDFVRGPSSSRPPYVVPTAPGWNATALLTVGDGADENGYRLAGMPDGLGVIGGAWSAAERKYVRPDLYMTVYMNHEMRTHHGIARAHGMKGAFVSQWTIELSTLRVPRGEDLIRRVLTWNTATRSYQDGTGTTIFDRFCSGGLAPVGAFYDTASGKGTRTRLFLNAEEADVDGRVWAHVVSGAQKGTSYQLPYLGKGKWEQAMPHPSAGAQTVVVITNDAAPGQVYVYIGDKQASGNVVQRAGLHGGRLYGVRVTNGGPNYGGGATRMERSGAINGRFELVDVTPYALASSDELDARSDQAGITEFARPEDGHWDPTDPRSFYFTVTGMPSTAQSARLYRLRFDGPSWTSGGSIELVVDSNSLVGTDGEKARGFDNLYVSSNGHVMLQEDGGSQAYLSKTWRIVPSNSLGAVQVARSNPNFFAYGGSNFLTVAEEHSGIVEVTPFVRKAPWFKAGRRYYLADIMDHSGSSDPELAQGGQLYLLTGPAN